MTPADFYDWKRHPVTQQIYSHLNARIELLKDQLVHEARSGNTTEQAYKAGAVFAYGDMLNISFEETQGD